MSCVLLVNTNSYQQFVYFTSANGLSAEVYKLSSTVTSYFNLKGINSDLQLRNAMLENEVISLKKELATSHLQAIGDSLLNTSLTPDYSFVMAQVINNSITRPNNYITLDKGRLDGIEPEMGVVDQNGIVGIIELCSDHASRAISVLNSNFRLSCKVKRNNYFGSLIWGGKDPKIAIIEELPKHGKFVMGDTIVTSGYSAVFPEGLIVGTICGSVKGNNDNFISLKVRLSTDFTQLSTIRVLKSFKKAELDSLNHDNL